jgi:lantibiotic modifying enzyme
MAHLAKVADTDPLSMLNHVIEYIYNKEQMWKIDDMSQKEITDFVETLSLTQVQKIMGKVEEFPRCCIKDSVTCPSCQKQQEINVEGLENFFT